MSLTVCSSYMANVTHAGDPRTEVGMLRSVRFAFLGTSDKPHVHSDLMNTFGQKFPKINSVKGEKRYSRA